MSEASGPHEKLDKAVRDLLDEISVCRKQGCPVPQKHPFYPVPDRPGPPDFLDGPVGCMPVVPTCLHKGGVMILGMYPTCRFATTGSEEEVPVRDIDEPFEDSRYFDGYGVRNVRSGTQLKEEYFEPLGWEEDSLWITNLVKCFLFKPEHIRAYDSIGWEIPDGFEATRGEFGGSNETERYYEAARLCVQGWLARELELCVPKLVIALGSDVCRMVHADQNFAPASRGAWTQARGKFLRAGSAASGSHERHPLFQAVNVFCLYHPGYIRRNAAARERHCKEHIPAVEAVWKELQ
jgi:uracil-DNA glycosylase